MANAQLQIAFVDDSGGQSLLYQNYRFHVKNRLDERVYWRCVVRTCPATIRTRNSIPFGFNLERNHPPISAKLEVNKVLQHIKKRCREETSPVPTIYKQEIA